MGAADVNHGGDVGGVNGVGGNRLALVGVVLAVDGDEYVKAYRVNQCADFRGQGAGAAAGGNRRQHARVMQGAEGGQHGFGHEVLPFAKQGVVNVEEDDFGGHGGLLGGIYTYA